MLIIGLMPHGSCFLWDRELTALYALSNFFIATPYMLIAGQAMKACFDHRQQLSLWAIAAFTGFGGFVFLCGIGHYIEIFNIWHSAYWFEASWGMGTAVVSSIVAFMYMPALDKFKKLMTQSAQSRQYQMELEQSIEHRMQVEEVLRSRNAELSRSNSELEQFSYTASHDLQAPLTTILSFTDLIIRRYELPDNVGNFLERIRSSATRMSRLIEDLREFSRIGRVYIETESIDLNDLVADVVNDISSDVERRDAAITVDFLPTVIANPVEMRQLFQNLLSNGLKFAHNDRRPQIDITCAQTEGGWMISVLDNGIGIDPQFFDAIFQIFHRLNPDHAPGTGIGLAVCKKIVERYGGMIWVEVPEDREGTVFCFTIRADRNGQLYPNR